MKIQERCMAITIDIINSKKEADSFERIKKMITAISADHYAFRPALSRGDEIQCVIAHGHSQAFVIRELRYALLPFKLKIGIGIGPIEIPSGASNSWDLSGEAFFRARKALDDIDGAENTSVKLISENSHMDLALNTVLRLMNVIMNDWTHTQFKYVMLYDREGTYERVAKLLDVSPQNVHKACKRANWDIISETEKNLDFIINEMDW